MKASKGKRQSGRVPLFGSGPELDPRPYGAGEAAEILGVRVWQLRNFLEGPAYRLGLFEQIGEGKGSRRTFSREALYRIATAMHLLHDGFRPAFVGRVLERLDEADFQELDSEGRHVRPGILLRRTAKGQPEMESFSSSDPPKIKTEGFEPYYALNLGWIMDEVNNRIRERRIKREEKRQPSGKVTDDKAELLSGKDE